MDFSKFSDESLVALKNGDYSKLSDDELKQLKQSTTDITTQPSPSKLDLALGVGKELYKTMTPMGRIQESVNQSGTKVAESLGQAGHPIAGAVIGTGVQMLPDIATTLAGTGEAKAAAQAGKLGMAGRVISGPGREEAGAAIGALEKAAGVHEDIIPTIKDVTANLGLKNANAKQYLNALMERLKSGEELSPQALSQHHKMIRSLLSQEPSRTARAIGLSGSKLGEPAIAQAMKADKLLVQKLNEAVPGRANEAANYAAAKIRGGLYKGAAGIGAAVLGKNAIVEAFNRLTGRR